MVTVKIEVEGYLCEYIMGKYGTEEGAARLRPGSDAAVLLYDLLSKRPADKPVDKGNLILAISERADGGKDPRTYNYISERSAAVLSQHFRAMMWAELHEAMDMNKHIHGIQFKETVYTFMTRYGIESISEDALLKNYQRWRAKQRRRSKRSYRFRK